jgi:aspartate carbamoyltransferase regulatory subunit
VTSRKPSSNKSQELRVQKIKDGTVIDHITAGYALAVLEILGISGREGEVISIVMNVQSKRMGKKDIIKVEGRELTQEEINRIALVAPNATINFIRKFKIHAKTRISVPDQIQGIVQCANPSCITNNERGITSRFIVIERKPVTLRCTYCNRITDHNQIVKQLLGK